MWYVNVADGPVVELGQRTPEPFIQSIFDVVVPRMAFGRVCLLGDAAFVLRPHAAAATRTKGISSSNRIGHPSFGVGRRHSSFSSITPAILASTTTFKHKA